MIDTGIVTGREITTNKDGDETVEMLEVQVSDNNDIQTVQLMTQAGDNSSPPDGSLVVIVDVGDAYKIAISVQDNITPTTNAGEKKFYSSLDGAIKAFINLKDNGDIEIENDAGANVKVLSDGNVEIQGNTDTAVAFADLKAGFDTLKAELNTFIGVFNGHDHVAGVGLPTSSGTPATASIDASELPTIKVP